ncbi:MAG: baseplate J/gp47 family protein [Oscillospiraceae bacterium]|nr:baseplate J/gp47 family protein [Oscillospiraceae bacterium]
MFEEITYEEILDRMKERVSDKYPELDIREGSVIHTALAPAAVEMKNIYTALDNVMFQTFADTADRDYLVLRAKERGISNPREATAAVRMGQFNCPVPIGTRFTLNGQGYIVKEMISGDTPGMYKLECEAPGEIGNCDIGDLIPSEYIDGLETARLTDIIVPGENEEDTEDFRRRYFDSLESHAFGGNIADYKEKILTLPAIGAVKVYPAWNGGGTVGVVILDSRYRKPSPEIVNSTQETVDPVQNQGQGEGFAPIGHVVTIFPADEATIDIESSVVFQNGYTWQDVKHGAEDAIDEYFQQLSKEWPDLEKLEIKRVQIASRLSAVSGIADVGEIFLNGADRNLMLDPNQIPRRGEVSASS